MKKFKNVKTGAIYTVVTPSLIEVFGKDSAFVEVKETKAKADKETKAKADKENENQDNQNQDNE